LLKKFNKQRDEKNANFFENIFLKEGPAVGKGSLEFFFLKKA